MTRNDAIRLAKDEFQQKRLRKERELSDRLDNAIRLDPEIELLFQRRAELPYQSVRLALIEKQNASIIAERMKTEGLELNRRIRERLTSIGLSQDYLKLQYDCPICKDTGFTENAPQKMCACLLKRINEMERESDGVTDFGRQNFCAYDESRIPEYVLENGRTQRSYTNALKVMCEEYADAYPKNTKPNMLIMGEAGLGKTFLLNCIAERIESRGYTATLVGAYRLLEIMRDRHFHTEDSEGDFERLLNCEILLIDDLGSEPVLRNITKEYLFILINERLLANRHTVVATNMMPEQIKERYDERVFSRLCDITRCNAIRLMGKDLRRI